MRAGRPLLAPAVNTPHKGVHNTSTLPRKQLVLELELRVSLLELVELLPCGISCRTPFLLDQQLPGAAVESCLDDLGRDGKNTTVANGRQRNHLSWRVADVLLEEHHMEDTVNAGAWWQSETIGDVSHPVQHLVGTVEVRRQLAGGLVGDGCCQALVETRPHPVSHSELSEPVAAIVLGLHQFLGVKEAIFDLLQERVSV
jgi:hypothetical protein